MNLLTIEPATPVVTVKPAFVTQRSTGIARQLVDEPEAGVVAGRGVFSARIAEPDDQFDHVQSWRRSDFNRTGKRPKKTRRSRATAGDLVPSCGRAPAGARRT